MTDCWNWSGGGAAGVIDIRPKVLGKHYHKNFETFRQNDPDMAHISFFFRGSLKHITPSVLKNYVRVPQTMDMKMHFRMLPVGRQVTDTLFLFGFYDNLYYTQGAHFYSIKMPKKKYQYTHE